MENMAYCYCGRLEMRCGTDPMLFRSEDDAFCIHHQRWHFIIGSMRGNHTSCAAASSVRTQITIISYVFATENVERNSMNITAPSIWL